MAKSWSKYGVDIQLPGKGRIIEWGEKTGIDVPTEVPN